MGTLRFFSKIRGALGTKQEHRPDSHAELGVLFMRDDRSSKSGPRQTEEQFHILVDSVEEYAIYMLDSTGNVLTWNSGAEQNQTIQCRRNYWEELRLFLYGRGCCCRKAPT